MPSSPVCSTCGLVCGTSTLSAETSGANRLNFTKASQPSDFKKNGWVVEALQGAWSATANTPIPQDDAAKGVFRVDHLRLALDAAVRGGGDTDTVAAIAGGLLGAAYGASAVPAEWRRLLHGWPGLRTRELVDLATAITRRGEPDGFGYSYTGYEISVLARHPYDEGVWLGDIGALRSLPEGVDAVVSLCRVGNADLPAHAEQIDLRLIDQPGPQRQLGVRAA
jgi:ADP-ribosyl-[dinitrogen reductase] hydrolase